jgi:hypothetical protein
VKLRAFVVINDDKDEVKRILIEDGKIIAWMFENGEIQSQHSRAIFRNGQEYWDIFATLEKINYQWEMSQSLSSLERQKIFNKYRDETETIYKFCFGKEISNSLIGEIVPEYIESNFYSRDNKEFAEKKKEVLSFIELIRESCPEIQTFIFTHGACYQFHLILKSRFPEAIPYYNENHVISKIGDSYFDITGEVIVDGKDCYTLLKEEPTDWGRDVYASQVISSIKIKSKKV